MYGDPNYLLDFSIFDEGVWTCVGGPITPWGKLPEAQKAPSSGHDPSIGRTTCPSSIWGWFWGGMEIAAEGVKRDRGWA